ncbi:MAG: hypothetical protein ACI9R3_000065 [Verrucomicrobiales bacterium]
MLFDQIRTIFDELDRRGLALVDARPPNPGQDVEPRSPGFYVRKTSTLESGRMKEMNTDTLIAEFQKPPPDQKQVVKEFVLTDTQNGAASEAKPPQFRRACFQD